MLARSAAGAATAVGRTKAAVMESAVAKRFFLCLLAIVVACAVVLYVLAWRPTIKAIDPPAVASFDARLVARGQALSLAGGCAGCHTAEGGVPYAGNRPTRVRYGTVWSANITPDPVDGIGRWPEAAFVRALREDVGREGKQLYSAYPHRQVRQASDADLAALYAYLMSQAPVRQAPHAPQLPFPLNWRPLQAAWKLPYAGEGTATR